MFLKIMLTAAEYSAYYGSLSNALPLESKFNILQLDLVLFKLYN